jgi:hypothetical protein
MGPTGDRGEMGPTGQKGDKGDASLTGSTGEMGPTGDRGEMGPTGQKGDKGDASLTGSTGEIGPTGSIGDTGAKGDTGEMGPTGDKGEIGATGSIGDTGEKGDTGEMGPTGDRGEIGATGSIGDTGEKGDTGEMGPTGDRGEIGATGSIGDTGAKGDTGEMGPTGDKGEIGATGSIGDTGEVGATGEKGEIGPTGERGEIGYTGAKGDKGDASLTGSTGDIGPTGYTGPKGDSGEATWTGATGAVGPTGPAGEGTGGGTYGNDVWLLNNLLGQPPAIQFGSTGPISKSTVIYIPWNYPTQNQVGWVANQWLPNITNFTASITSDGGVTGATGSYPIVSGQAASAWIRNNTSSTQYATLLAIQKNATTSAFVTLTPDPLGTAAPRYAYTYYDSTLSAALKSNSINTFSAYYSNPSTIGSFNSSSISFYGFLAGGAPSAPRSVTRSGGTSTSITITWSAPEYADIINTSEGTISSYDISYNTTGSAIRYNSGVAQSGTTNSISGLSTTLSSLYPDASYSIVVLATNNSGLKGPYSTLITGYSSFLVEPTALSSISLALTNSYSTSSTIYKVQDNTSLGSIPLIKGTTVTTNAFDTPIHRLANRGKLQGAGTLMTLSARLNSVDGPSVQYTGFPIPSVPSAATANNMTITPASISDYYASITAQDGFYLKSSNTITVSGGVSAGNGLNTLTAKQTFSDTTTATASTTFYSDNSATLTTGPTGAVNTLGILSTYFAKVSGVSILYGTPTMTIDASANNMGSYFYRSPLITYTYTNGSNTGTKSETNLAAVQSSDDINVDRFTTGNLSFKSSFILPTLANNTYSTSITIAATANNIFGSGTLTSKSMNVITDMPSYTLVYSTLSASIATLNANTPANGYRIWSAPSVSNNCPDLLYNGTSYLSIPYNNNWDITSTNQSGYNVTTELLISNGQFTTVRSAYLDYSGYLMNSGINYSGISATGYRFASFCWKLNASNTAYTNLSFTINSILTPTLTDSKLLLMNGVQAPIFYAFQDTSSPSYNDTTFNTVWINANSNTNGVSSGNFYDTNNKYGYYGGITSAAVTLSGSNATINAFIPAINPVKATIYLYLRIAVPMNTEIKFGSVSATIR